MEQEIKKSGSSAGRHAHAANNNKKRPQRSLLILLLLLLLLLAVVAGAMLVGGSRGKTESTEPTGPVFAANASIGALPGKTQEEIQAMLQQQVDDRMVAFSINANPEFENGTAKGKLLLEAPANNINYIEFVIKRDDNGQTIYRSGLMKPNQYIEEDKLSVNLPKGEYPCTVDITLYDPETLEAKGMSQAGITIVVKN